MTTLLIKNMVCDRCKKVIKDELEAIDVRVINLELGRLEIEEGNSVNMKKVNEVIISNGFEIIESEEVIVVEHIKLFLRALINNYPIQRNEKISVLVATTLNKDYSVMSKIFSRNEGMTLEKFFLKLKLEKVKELIQEDKYSFSEISDLLDYANSNHLAKQFKGNTGISMTEYKNSQNWDRKPLDKII